MAKESEPEIKKIYQLKVTLRDSKPPIWRRIQVPADITLHRLHLILQVVMGWGNYHLYGFRIKGRDFGEPDTEDDIFNLNLVNSHRTKLNKVLTKEKTQFIYDYDFGDSWEHRIVLEKILPVDPDKPYPVCIKGKRACPPEDCGGIWGYYDLLEIMKNPNHKEYAEMMDWVGGEFDTEEFDIEEINRLLNR